VSGELLFHVSGSIASAAEPIGLAEAGLRERDDLQEWVLNHPQILGDGVRVVTFEFDRWEAGRGAHPLDRLDVLGLGDDGRLVVAELKRDVAPDTVYSQAIKYAAMASRFDVQTLAEQHARYLSRQGAHVSSEQAWQQLVDHAPDLDESTLRTPRIVLLARDFTTQVTAAAVWLNEMGLDVTLIRFQAYRAEDRIVLTVGQILPVPKVEDFTVAPQRAEARNSGSSARAGQRESSATRRLVDAGAVADGRIFTLRPMRAQESILTRLNEWLAEDARRGIASWRQDPYKPLVWQLDGQAYTPGGLVRVIIAAATGEERSVEGTRWWIDPDGFDLVELAAPLAGGRSLLYREFWERLIEQAAAQHPDWRISTAPAQNWIQIPSGYRLAYWSLSFASGPRLRSEFYLEAGLTTADERYGQLAQHAADIDVAYGSPLSWEPLPNRKACRVADYLPGVVEHTDAHDAYIRWMIDTQDRLRTAIAAAAPAVAWMSS
jgi:Domain of unknown function (DUF4268)